MRACLHTSGFVVKVQCRFMIKGTQAAAICSNQTKSFICWHLGETLTFCEHTTHWWHYKKPLTGPPLRTATNSTLFKAFILFFFPCGVLQYRALFYPSSTDMVPIIRGRQTPFIFYPMRAGKMPFHISCPQVGVLDCPPSYSAQLWGL